MAFAAALRAPALADCGQDMQKLAQARNAEMESINDYVKSFKGKPMDPAGVLRQDARASCAPRAR